MQLLRIFKANYLLARPMLQATDINADCSVLCTNAEITIFLGEQHIQEAKHKEPDKPSGW